MLPVCSAAPTSSPPSPISLHGGTRIYCPLLKIIDDRRIAEDGFFLCTRGGFRSRDARTHAAKYTHSLIVERPDQSGSLDSSIFSPYTNELDDIVHGFPNDYLYTEPQNWSYSAGDVNRSYSISDDIRYMESSTVPGPEVLNGKFSSEASSSFLAVAEPLESSYTELDPSSSSSSSRGDGVVYLTDTLGQSRNALSEPTTGSLSASSAMTSTAAEGPVPISDASEVANNGLSNLKESVEQLSSGINESIGTSIDRVEGVLRSTYDTFTSATSDTLKSVNRTFESVLNGLFFSADSTKQQAASNLSGLSSKVQEKISGAGVLAVDVLRQAIVTLEESLANTAAFVVYFYGSAKLSLPPNVRDVLNLSEEKVNEVLTPVGSAFQKVYIVIEGLEKTLGLDPSDPIVPFILLLGSSATIGASLWLYNYGGYSGDLIPEITSELLKNDGNAVLIDVRPEDLRKRDGIPDLRRGARAKYACVTSLEIDGSLRKMLRSGKEIDDVLTAVLIRNLKIVQDGSKVIVMDQNGSQAKAVARSLKKLGVKKPYLVQGGFQSWVKKGLRVKELKPATTLTVLNEEAEAILEDIKPTPALVIGYGLGISAAIYGLLEWEKTLQVIGIIGIVQTVYRRFASYEDSEDFKKDVSLLLAPVRVGAQAITWAAKKLEPNKIGLPISPSSTAVQDRVLQAAAKHESQPSDSEEAQGRTSDNLDLSEA